MSYRPLSGECRRKDLAQAGVKLTGRAAGADSESRRLEDGSIPPVESVIWATGFRPSCDWIELDFFDEQGYPRHKRGAVEEAPGLYFLGLPFGIAFNSAIIGGLGRDAKYIAGKAVQA